MTQFADNIRRIARGNRKKGALGIYTERDPVPGGTVFLVTNPDLLNGNAPATSNGSNSPEAQEEAEEDKNKQTDPNNPNTFNKGGTGTGSDSAQPEGVADIGDAIDGTAGPQMPTTGGGISGQGGIRELTGLKDCETGKEFNLHLDGNFVPPEGWVDPDTPPVPEPPEGYEPGFFWYRVSSGLSTAMPDPVSVYRQIIEDNPSTEWVSGSVLSFSGDGNTAQVEYTVRLLPSGNEQIFADSARRDACIGYPSNTAVQNACAYNPSDDAQTSWPEDGAYDVAIKDGQFQTNQYDADAPDNFEPSGTKSFCYQDGVDGENNPIIKNGTAHVTADGGTMYYQTNEAGAPTGDVRVHDSSGQLVAQGTATESFISQYLPQ